MSALHEMSARRIAEGVRAREFRALEVADHFLERAARLDGDLRAFLCVDPELTRRHARQVDERIEHGRNVGPLAGVPVAVKDNICLQGLPTTCASRMLEGWRPPYHADAVEKLLAADAVPLGKTNLDEFAMGSSTEHGAFGPTRNPWDLGRVPGGSSGGSAAAVGAGLAPIAIGSDTGGSVRQPAALCGVFGMVGTYGRVSRRGLVAYASSLDRIGPFARSSDDLALVLATLAGGDDGDATSLREPPPDWSTAVTEGVRGLRVGVLRNPVEVDAAVEAACEAALDALGASGALLVDVELPRLEDALAAYYLVAPAEASSNLARYDGVRFGLRAVESRDGDGAGDGDAAAMTRATRRAGFGREVKRRVLLGTFALSAGYAAGFYDQALRVRNLVAQDFGRAFESADVVVCPTSPCTAFPLGSRLTDPLDMYRCDVFAVPASLAGLPAASVPVGAGGDGLPAGLQVAAPARREDLVFRVAGTLERRLGPCRLPEAFA